MLILTMSHGKLMKQYHQSARKFKFRARWPNIMDMIASSNDITCTTTIIQYLRSAESTITVLQYVFYLIYWLKTIAFSVWNWSWFNNLSAKWQLHRLCWWASWGRRSADLDFENFGLDLSNGQRQSIRILELGWRKIGSSHCRSSVVGAQGQTNNDR